MAAKRPLPFILPARLDERGRLAQLRRYKIKPSNISKIYEADGWVLYIPTKKSFFKLPGQMVPSRELEHRIKRIHDYIEEYRSLIELERRAEMDAQIAEIRSLSGREREIYGRAVLNLKGAAVGKKFDLYIVRFSRDRLIESEISGGDIVLISRSDPLKSDLTATVTAVAKNYIEAAFSKRPPVWIKDGGIRVDLFVNDVTFKRMESNLERMRHIKPPFSRIRDILLGLEEPSGGLEADIEIVDGKLNEAQKEAICLSLAESEITLVHGPPGTGKTTTLIETILQAVKSGKRVLAAADSNVAVDNMLRKLAKKDGLDIVRIGHPARIGEGLERYSLFCRIEEDPQAEKVKEMLENANELVRQRSLHSKPTPSRLRGMSKERVKKIAAEGRSYRGVDAATIRSMAEWIRVDEKVERLFGKIRKLEESIVHRIVTGADVVLSTNGMIGSEALDGIDFDFAAVDEASQQMEPSTLLSVMRAPKVVLAGDHRQLPPTVVSGNDLLKKSLFERMMESEAVPSRMLEVQYRMNETIMSFPNTMMYDGKLTADESAAKRVVALAKEPTDQFLKKVLQSQKPVVFIDTSRMDACETLRPRSTSYENEYEAAIVADIVKSLLDCGLDGEKIGVITPYLAQVKLIRQMLERDSTYCEVKSVDGFQGREKEVIIISLVRSNIAGEIGFVKDRRRLNVAMTRARSKLIMVGDRNTLVSNDPFDLFFKWLDTQREALSIGAPDQ